MRWLSSRTPKRSDNGPRRSRSLACCNARVGPLRLAQTASSCPAVRPGERLIRPGNSCQRLPVPRSTMPQQEHSAKPILLEQMGFTILQHSYRSGAAKPSEVIARLYPLLDREHTAFITLASLPDLQERCRYPSFLSYHSAAYAGCRAQMIALFYQSCCTRCQLAHCHAA